MKEIKRKSNEDRAAIEKISQATKSNHPNSSNQMEHNIKIYSVKKPNKHESGVIF